MAAASGNKHGDCFPLNLQKDQKDTSKLGISCVPNGFSRKKNVEHIGHRFSSHLKRVLFSHL